MAHILGLPPEAGDRDTMPFDIRRLLTLAALAAPVVAPGSLPAQARAIHGRVTDSTGVGIRDADVGIVAQRRLLRTDDSGRFVIAQLPPGVHEITVRRLGYTPRRLLVDADTVHDTLRVRLRAEPFVLEGVAISARDTRLRHGIEEFYRRRVKGVGTYWTRDDIEHYNTQRTSDVLRTAPGIRLVRVSSGMGVRFNATSIVRRDCTPMIWLDGQRAPGLEVDDVLTRDIEGIELYSGPSTTPMQFSQYASSSTCGTIVIWTRIPG